MNEHPHFFAAPSGLFLSRRNFLRRTGSGCGLVALASILNQAGLLSGAENIANKMALNPLASRPGHFQAKAKSIIWLFMNGG